jgi:hypothetical protein
VASLETNKTKPKKGLRMTLRAGQENGAGKYFFF